MFFTRVSRFQILMCVPLSIWCKLLGLSWLYRYKLIFWKSWLGQIPTVPIFSAGSDIACIHLAGVQDSDVWYKMSKNKRKYVPWTSFFYSKVQSTVVIRELRPEFKFPAKIDLAFSTKKLRTTTDNSNFDKRCSDAHYVSSLSYYYCTTM